MTLNSVTTLFRDRLDACATSAALSTADLAWWFDLPYATVKSWRSGSMPRPNRRSQVEERLRCLEKVVKTDKRFPVPLNVRASERAAYLRAIFLDA